MSQYKILMKYADGTEEYEDDVFDSEEAAEEYAEYLVGCSRTGAEILNWSNPGDYPLEEMDDDPEYEIIEIDD